MTNCDKIRSAVRSYAGEGLTSGKIVSLVLSMYPGANPTSIIPSDHSGPNPRSGRSYCSCSGKHGRFLHVAAVCTWFGMRVNMLRRGPL
jgi:hypothetical protein